METFNLICATIYCVAGLVALRAAWAICKRVASPVGLGHRLRLMVMVGNRARAVGMCTTEPTPYTMGALPMLLAAEQDLGLMNAVHQQFQAEFNKVNRNFQRNHRISFLTTILLATVLASEVLLADQPGWTTPYTLSTIGVLLFAVSSTFWGRSGHHIDIAKDELEQLQVLLNMSPSPEGLESTNG